jgi:hypothetical protein
MKKMILMVSATATVISFAISCPAGQGEGPASGDPALTPPKMGEARRKYDECMRKCRGDYDSCNEPFDKPVRVEKKRTPVKAAADCSKIKSTCEKECRESYKKSAKSLHRGVRN